MRIAVAGGTGRVGVATVQALQDAGHEVVVLTRSEGVDLLSADGLDDALAGVQAVADTTSTADQDPEATRAFFGTVTENLLAAGERAGVGHHVALSIIGMESEPDLGHYVGKLYQEDLVRAGPLPFTILRAPQFYKLGEMMVGWTRDGGRATVPAWETRAASAADVGRALAEVALDNPANGIREVVGPEIQNLADMAKRTMEAAGDPVEIESGDAETKPAPEPAPGAIVAPTTFEQWLAARG